QLGGWGIPPADDVASSLMAKCLQTDKEVAMRIKLLAAILSAPLLLSSCASIFTEQVYPVQVTSSPSGANVEIKDEDGNIVYNGITPATVKLEASAGYFDGQTYTVRFRKDGYADETTVIDSGVEGWYWGNLLLGGVLGMLIIDPSTGAMFDLPSKASTTMKETAAPQEAIASAATYSTSTPGLSRDQWQQQQLQQLQAQPMSYEEYQRRYQQIMAR
uniref:hypothetical protein n=1 Tax=Pseudomonas sp. RW407 TaxID=2202894 RepID=UPI001C484916